MYKGEKFGLRDVEEIKKDIDSAKELEKRIKELSWRCGYGERIQEIANYYQIYWLTNREITVFFGDADSLIINSDRLLEIIEYLYKKFPNISRITSYARAKTILKKKKEELIKLKNAGLSRLHLGLETGDEELLKYVNKGVTPQELISAGKKVKETGISLSEYIILGLGGKERTIQHALNSAKVLNEINPDFIRIRTLVLLPPVPLFEKLKTGEFTPLSPEEILEEEKILLENLSVSSEFVSDHISNYLSIDGKLPQDKEKMLKKIERTLELLKKSPSLKEEILQKEYLRGL
jgi:radical SAM superfamily enzyme YgiQ (UPF0313 family)